VPAGNPRTVIDDPTDSLVRILDLVRDEVASTRPELVHASGYGRTLITQRLAQLQGVGLVSGEELRTAVRGRAPVILRFVSERAALLVAELGPASVSVGLANLRGEITSSISEKSEGIAVGLAVNLDQVERLFDRLLAERQDDLPIWGIGIGIPAPVQYLTGRPVGSAITPLWEDFPVRDRLEGRYHVPVWVDNDVNLMTLGEFRAGRARDKNDVIYVRVASGIGAGILSEGRLHRGATGAAGQIAHVEADQNSSVRCYCGKTGCLVAIASGAALVRAATEAVDEHVDSVLAGAVRAGRQLTISDVVVAAQHGDRLSTDLLLESARAVGSVLSSLVNFHNPAQVLLGGPVAHSGDAYLAAVREEIFRQSHPLATRRLSIDESALEESGGMRGAAFMVIDELLSRERIGKWINSGSPTAVFNASEKASRERVDFYS
jgi:predicted NBD/HSP70 family sugar kinase